MRHSLQGNEKEAEKWKVSTGSDGDGIGWVLRIPGDLGLEDDVGTNSDEIGVLKHVDEASFTSNLCKETCRPVWESWGWMIALSLFQR